MAEPEQGPEVPSHRVKGGKIREKLAFVEKRWGEPMRRRVVESLPPEDRAQLSLVLDIGWYPLDLYDRLLEAIVEVAGGSDAAVLDRMGRSAAEYQAESAYRVYFRKNDPLALVRAMAPMHAQLNDPGRMEVVEHGDRHLELVVHDPPGTEAACRVARAFYGRALELCGARLVHVEETACQAEGDPACRFQLQWRGSSS